MISIDEIIVRTFVSGDLEFGYDPTAREPVDRGRLLNRSCVLPTTFVDLRNDRANERDSAALLRDAAADDADLIADQWDFLRTEVDLAAIAQHPERADDLYAAIEDRRRSADDRTRARADRRAAYQDRIEAALDRSASSIDHLTGTYRRDAGIAELKRDLDAAKRDQRSMLLGFIDVDGLKAVNDLRGHPSGDDLLRQVARTVSTMLRSFDPVVRFGGDEFLFGAIELPIEAAADRMVRVNAALGRSHGASITVGLAASRPSDTLNDLITRADLDLYQNRQANRAEEHR